MTKKFLLFIGICLISNISNALVINNEEPVFYFVNHQKQLFELREKLITTGTVGITGISGMGKSEMAKKYVSEYKQDYELIVFVDGSIDLIPQFVEIAKEINQKICTNSSCYISDDPKKVKESLMNYLKRANKWLLIFDNLHVNENVRIKQFIDWRHSGHIIICSQDAKYLEQKIAAPYLSNQDSEILINKIMKYSSNKFANELAKTLYGYPPYVIGHSAVYLYNNNHMTIEQYMSDMKRQNNKIRTHLKIILTQMSAPAKELLYKIALLNNQKISRNLIHLISNDSVATLSDSIDENIRFGLIEQISEDRNNQVFRMHDSIKAELLNITSDLSNRSKIESILNSFNKLIPDEEGARIATITSDKTLEGNIELLLTNADMYKVNIHRIMELREKLLWYYLIGSRQPYYAKKMADWFKNEAQEISLRFCSAKEKYVYGNYLTYVGRFEFAVANKDPNEALKYMRKAQKIAEDLPGNDEQRAYIYSHIAQIQSSIGEIQEAINYIKDAESLKSINSKIHFGAGFIEHIKSKIFLAQGEYEKALGMIILSFKEKEISMPQGQKVDVSKKNLFMFPELVTHASILNYMGKFKESNTLLHTKILPYLKNKTKGQGISMAMLARIITELSRSELGLNYKNEALRHANEAVELLVEDKERNNRNIENSNDVFLAPALVAKADAMSALGNYNEAVVIYKLAKEVYHNIYGDKNMKYMDNVSCLFKQGAKVSAMIKPEEDKQLFCSYFYKLHVKVFNKAHPRDTEIRNICSFN